MSKTLVGIDIGTITTKATQLTRDRDSAILHAAGFIGTPQKGLASNNIEDEQVLASSINRLVHDMKVTTSDCVVSLPSSRVVSRVIQIPNMSEKDLESSIQWEAEQYIPWPLSKVKIDYAILEKNDTGNKMKVLLVAAPVTTVEKFMRIISMSGLTPIALEPEILAVVRSVTTSLSTLPNVIILSIGAITCDIALIRERNLIFGKTLPIGGNTLTKAISQELAFEYVQAEEYKKTYGLEEDKLEGKVAKILSPFITNIFDEIEKSVAYFKELYPKEEVKSVVLSGGGAKLPGLVLSITKFLGLDCQLSNPFLSLKVDPNILPIITPDAPIYTAAVGLALKET